MAKGQSVSPVGETLYVDEISFKKGYSDFETVIYSDETIVETMSGKKGVDLQNVLTTLPGITEVKTVCMDMCASFASAVRQALPHAEIVLDRFHIVKLLNQKLDKLRKKTHRNLTKGKQRRFSHIRFILFKDYRALGKDQRRLLKEYLRLNTEMRTIYWQCQEFRSILFGSQGKSRSQVSSMLTNWCDRVKKNLRTFVKTLQSWWDETLNACLFKLSNARAEGVNNRIKLLKRQGFGFRNRLNFRLRLFALSSL